MFAALHLPDLAMAAALRVAPEFRARPCAVLPLEPGAILEKVKLPLLAVNAAARATGIDGGWPLNRALVRCPDLKVLPPAPAAEEVLRDEMIALAEGLTPDLEIAGRDLLLLDLSRAPVRQVEALAGSVAGGELLRYALAATPDLAALAVLHAGYQGRRVDSADLAPLPMALAGAAGWPEAERLLPLLADWGIATLGAFMALPRQALIERLGAAAGAWHDLLLGKSCRLLRLHRPPENLAQTVELEDPVPSVEPLLFLARRLLHALSARLAARHLAAGMLKVSLRLESGAGLLRWIRLPEPRVQAADLLRPVQTMLESLQLESAVSALELDVETVLPTAAQREWFSRQLPHPERWRETLAQLTAWFGAERVGVPVPPASHRPDDFRVLPPGESGEGPAAAGGGAMPENPVPLRRFRPPYEIAVVAEPGAGVGVLRPLALLTGPCRGRIVDRRGPFYRSADWWQPAALVNRMEWDVEVEGRQLLRLVFQAPDRWLLEGRYE